VKTLQKIIGAAAFLAIGTLPATGKGDAPNVREIFDRQLRDVEHEVMDVVEAMPANKFGFVPTAGAFEHVRTFGAQARHIGFCLNEVAVALLAEPMLPHPDQEGPKKLTSKQDVVRYLKDAFSHAHRALGTLTNDNLREQIADPYAEGLETTRLDAATIFLTHTWDHYGQMVEYLRMNQLAPPGHR
jgi:hypothetical protein